MTNQELIKILQTLDPNAEVVIAGEAILGAVQLPGYYDGYYQKILPNDQGIHFTRTGTKIELYTTTLEDLIWRCNSLTEIKDLTFTFDSSLHSEQIEKIKQKIDKITADLQDFLMNR